MRRIRAIARRTWPAWLAAITMGCSSEAGTPPPGDPPSSQNEMELWVSTTLSGMSLEDKVSQLFVTYIYGQSPDSVEAKNQQHFGKDTAAQVVEHYRPGGVIYFNNDDADNIENPKQIAALSNGLQRAALRTGAKIPLFIATDQEQGIVTRIGAPATTFPGNMALCAGRSTEDAKQAAAITGRELRAMGINVDFAPDADVNSNALNPVIGVRSYSSDPKLASDFVTAQVDGYQNSGWFFNTVSATAKHFPGHGDTKDDSHTSLPVTLRTLEEWRKIEAPPFIAAKNAGIDLIMTAHIQTPNIDPSGEPSTLSKIVVTDLLREEIGYQGLIITDSLRMEGVRKLHTDAEIPVLALKAGVDQLLMPVNLGLAVQSVIAAVNDGTLSVDRIEQSVRRVLRAKFKRGILIKPLVDEDDVMDVVGVADHLAASDRITDRTVTVLRNEGNRLPLKTDPANVLVTGWGVATTQTLADEIKLRGPNATTKPVNLAPTDSEIAAAVTAANQSDLVIVLTNTLTKQVGQQKLVTQLLATQKPVIAIAVRNPYDAGHSDEAPVWLVTYSYTTGSMKSVAKILFGEISPVGKLPVDIPSGSDPTVPRYKLGDGLTW